MNTRYGVLYSDLDEDWEHKEFYIYEPEIYNTRKEAEETIERLDKDSEYEYQEFKIVEIFGD